MKKIIKKVIEADPRNETHAWGFSGSIYTLFIPITGHNSKHGNQPMHGLNWI
eukprot:Pgem_evm1s20312